MKILIPIFAVVSPLYAVSITDCHKHGDDVFCITSSGGEVQVLLNNPLPGDPPSQYTDCHAHGDTTYCVDADGNDVEILGEITELSSADTSSTAEETASEQSTGGQNCHFHAGVEHCVGAGESESGSEPSCGIQTRDYNMPLRIGSLFVVLITSAIGVFLPMGLTKLKSAPINHWALMITKQFGTGVIVSTALVHLYTHADLMFGNECIGTLAYESTTSAIVMAGILLAFLTEFLGHRFILWRTNQSLTSDSQLGERGSSVPVKSTDVEQVSQPSNHDLLIRLGHHHEPRDLTNPNSKLSVIVMEAGIIFHSILIGLTLVVAGDSFYKTLLVVIVFHQFFEGLAIGARIALLPKCTNTFPVKTIMGAIFALITPIGMAIGMGVIHSFNGRDRETLLAMGTLDALSAGILIWVGGVDMWARDWVVDGGDLTNAPIAHTCVGLMSLIAGMVLMSVLGKWA